MSWKGVSASYWTPCGEVREGAGSFVIETPLILEHGCVCPRVPHGRQNGSF